MTWRLELRSFLSSSTIHGLPYLTSNGEGGFFRRIFWSLVVLTAFALAAVLIRKTLAEGARNPIMTYTEIVPVQDVPFPAVTVSASHPIRPQGLMVHMLDRFCFDESWRAPYDNPRNASNTCSGGDSDMLRRDFNVLIQRAALSSYNTAVTELDEPAYVRDILLKTLFFTDVNDTLLNLAADKHGGSLLQKLHQKNFANKNFVEQVQTEFRTNIYDIFEKVERVWLLEQDDEQNDDDFKHLRVNFVDVFEISLASALHVAAYYASQGDQLEPLPFGVFFNSYYDDFLYYGTHYHNDVEKTKEVKHMYSHLANVSHVVLKDEQLNIMDLPQFVDSRFLVLAEQVSDFYGCSLKLIEDQAYPEECRELFKILDNKLEDVMQVMKWTLYPMSSSIPNLEFDLDYGERLKELRYTTMSNPVPHPLLIACEHGASFSGITKLPFHIRYDNSFEASECIGFFKSFTTAGIGYSYNTALFWDMYQSSPRLETFYDIMYPKGNLKLYDHLKKKLELPKSDILDSLWNYVLHPKGSGPKYGLKMYISSDDLSLGPAQVLLHSPFDPPNVEGSAIKLAYGQEHTIYITPSKYSTSPELASMPLKERHCLFSHESESLKLFRNYSQAGCLFECSLVQAMEKCECVPWDFPHFDPEVRLCERRGDQCFRAQVTNPLVQEACECPRDCNSITYSYSVVSTPIDSHDAQMCFSLSSARWMSNKLFVEDFFDPLKKRHGLQMPWIQQDPTGSCQVIMSQVAVVQLQLASDSVTEVSRRKRVTFTDQLANLGGVIGLFCGMSILSLVEVVFWAAKVVRAIFGRKKKHSGLGQQRNSKVV